MSIQPSRLYISSYYRRNTDSASNFTVTLPSQVNNPKQLAVISAVIPYLCYNFGETESIFYFMTTQSGATVKQVTVNTQKVYNSATEFQTDFNALLAAAQPGVSCSINTNDGRVTIGNSGGNISIVGIANRETNWNSTYYNNIANRLGFYNAPGAPTTPSTSSVTSSGSFQLIRTSAFFLSMDCISGDSYTSNSAEQCVSNIMFMLPVQDATFGALNYYQVQDFEMTRASELPYSIYTVNVRVLDDKYDEITDMLPSASIQLELALKYEKE